MTSPTSFDFCLIFFLTVLGALAQLFLKKGAMQTQGHFLSMATNLWIILGAMLMIGDTIGLVYVLRTLPLVFVMPLTALVYLFVPLGAMVIFHEKVSKRFWIGAVLLVTGVCVISLG